MPWVMQVRWLLLERVIDIVLDVSLIPLFCDVLIDRAE